MANFNFKSILFASVLSLSACVPKEGMVYNKILLSQTNKYINHYVLVEGSLDSIFPDGFTLSYTDNIDKTVSKVNVIRTTDNIEYYYPDRNYLALDKVLKEKYADMQIYGNSNNKNNSNSFSNGSILVYGHVINDHTLAGTYVKVNDTLYSFFKPKKE